MHPRIALLASACALLLMQGCASSSVPLRPYAMVTTGTPVWSSARPGAAGAPTVAVAPGAGVAATAGTGAAPPAGLVPSAPGASGAGMDGASAARADAAIPALPTGLSIGELLQMLQARRPQIDIAGDLRARGLRVAPAPADFDVLAAAGASPELLQLLGATPAQAEAFIANGGIAQPDAGAGQQALVGPQAIALYDTVYPWVPFGFGLGFGYYAASAHYWGHAPFWAYPPVRVGGWRYTLPRPSVHPHFLPGRIVIRGPGFRTRR